ncbi:MAG TPA: PAS domain S-box protein [Rhodocyclaceae bacterium]|nr:PAS domain S-box protein [Rhodocyclaceae bacterium]
MFAISPSAALALSLAISMLLAASLRYVAAVERPQTALRAWAAAFACHAVHDAALLAPALTHLPLALLAPVGLMGMSAALWIGLGRVTGDGHSPRVMLLPLLAALWALVPTAPGRSEVLRTLPVDAVAITFTFAAARVFWRRATYQPGTGHRLAAVGLGGWGLVLLAGSAGVLADGSVARALAAALALSGLGCALLINALCLQNAAEARLTTHLRAEMDRRIAAESALAESHSRFTALAESSDLGLFVVSPDGQFQYTNSRYRALSGLTDEELRTRPDTQRMDGEDAARVSAAWAEARALRCQTHYERRVVQSGATEGWLSVHVAPITAGDSLQGFVATVEDITARKQAEAALRDSEERLSQVFRLLPDAVMLSDPDSGRIDDVNQGWTDTLGHPREATLGRTAEALGLWCNPSDARTVLDTLRAGHDVSDQPATLCHRDGRVLETLLRARLIRVRGRDGLLTVIRDVTEPRRLERIGRAAADALRVSEAMFSAAFRASPDYLTISRLDGHLLEVNPTFERMTGWRRDEAIGAQAVELGLWAFPEEREAMLHELSVHGAVTDFPCTLGTRWKTRRTCLLNVSMVTLENEPCLVGMIHDITEQQAAEKALRDSERKFATIFNLAPFALSLTRVGDRTHVDANPAWERLFGIERNTVLGRTSGEFGCWTDPRAYDDLYARVVSSDVLAQQEIRIRPCNRDDVATCLISGQRLRIRDEECALWAMVDISELRRAQARIEELNQGLELRVVERTTELSNALEALRRTQEDLVRSEKLAALGSMVAGIAHELNTPLGNSVTVTSTLATRTDELTHRKAAGPLRRSDLESYLDSVRTASDLLLRSLSRARDLVSSFKQVAVDQTSEQRRRFELGEVLREVVTTLGPMFKGTPYTLRIEPAPALEMDSYPGPLGQVITNLVSNALVHAFAGRDHGTITLTPAADGPAGVTLCFRDDGHGIDPAHLGRIFDPFFTTRLGTGGSGLGLHIVYNMVTRVLGGRLEVSSQLGVGTTFTLAMPRTAPATGGAENPMSISAKPAGRSFNFEDNGPII